MNDYTPIVVALIVSTVPLLGIVLTYLLSRKKIAEVHLLVNSRLSEALDEIGSLRESVIRKDAVISEQAAKAEDVARTARKIPNGQN